MSVVEKRLKEIGYKLLYTEHYYKKKTYIKEIGDCTIYIKVKRNGIVFTELRPCIIATQRDVDEIQIAFRVYQRDLEELKEWRK